MIDTHCHLTFPDYSGRVEQTLRAAAENGVVGAITVSTTSGDALDALGLAMTRPNLWCTAGIHPLYSDREPHDLRHIEKVIRHEKCVAWGEIGLDNHYDRPPKGTQLKALEAQIEMIERATVDGIDKPVVLHCREAFEELISILGRSSIDPGRFVFHCFTGGPADMRMLLDFGAMVSFTGVVTYKNAKEVQEAALLAPLDRIMVETDAPFLTPEPHRGVRPNEPRFARATATFLAALRKESWSDFHNAINVNTERFFRIWGIS